MQQPLLIHLAFAGVACFACSDSSSSQRDAAPTGVGNDAAEQATDSGHASQDAARAPVVDANAQEGGSTLIDAGQRDAGDDAAALTSVAATFVYQGGYGSDYPLRTFSLNRETGALTQVGSTVNLGPDPTFIAPAQNGRALYVANENNQAGVTSATLGVQGGVPTKLATAQSQAGDSVLNAMVYTSLSPNGKYVLAANYNGASVAVFPVGSDSKLGGRVDFEQFAAGSQSHSVRVHKSGKWAFVPNKGADSIAQFKFDQSSGQLTPNTPANKDSAAGAGPRHIAFSPNGKFAYVINEVNSTLSAYRVSSQGLLEDIESESTLPSNYSGPTNTAAHVLVHPNGKYVYGSNRGDNSIVVFSLATDGSMTRVEFEPTRGDTPRDFDIDSQGKVLVVANQGSGSLAVFSIASDGKLSPLGDLVNGLISPASVSIVNVMNP